MLINYINALPPRALSAMVTPKVLVLVECEGIRARV